MKKIIRPRRIINGQSDLGDWQLKGPAHVSKITLGNGNTGYVYMEDGWIFLVESADPASAYSNMDELADYIASTWRD